MRNSGMRGLFTGVMAWAVLVVLAFSLSSAVYLEQNDKTLVKMQASHELSEKTENMVRLLDKATAEDYYNYINNGLCSRSGFSTSNLTNFNNVLANFNNGQGNAGKAYSCSITPSVTTNGQSITVTGALSCSVTLYGSTITETRNVSLAKTAASPPCTIRDNVSGCTEQPGLSC